MSLGLYSALVLGVGSLVAWAALPFGSYVASLPSAIFAALLAILLAWRVPRERRADPRGYLWPTAAFFVVIGLLALGMGELQRMGATV